MAGSLDERWTELSQLQSHCIRTELAHVRLLVVQWGISAAMPADLSRVSLRCSLLDDAARRVAFARLAAAKGDAYMELWMSVVDAYEAATFYKEGFAAAAGYDGGGGDGGDGGGEEQSTSQHHGGDEDGGDVGGGEVGGGEVGGGEVGHDEGEEQTATQQFMKAMQDALNVLVPPKPAASGGRKGNKK